MHIFPLWFGLSILLYQTAFWLLRLKDLYLTHRSAPVLCPPSTRPAPPPKDIPRISVMIPARNEAAGIRECVLSALAQDYPIHEIIVVDDRSTDGTAAIVRELQKGRPRLKLVQVSEVRDGWTGKCNALDVGVRHAEGEWLAFLDADARLAPQAISKCMSEARSRKVNMVTLTPKFDLRGFWERALGPAFAAMSAILYPLNRINDPDDPIASANGMFYLISRHAYDKIHGHRDVRGLAVEDIGIGKRVKALGLGLYFGNGRNLLTVRMYEGLGQTVRGWTRILSASMNYSLSAALKYLVMHLMMCAPVGALGIYWYAGEAAELWPRTWFALPALTMGLMAVGSSLYCKAIGVSAKCSSLIFVGNAFLIGIFAWIIVKIMRGDALEWRGDTYRECRYAPTNLGPEALVLAGETRPVREAE